MKHSARLVATATLAATALLVPASAHAAQVKDPAGDVTGMNGTAASSSAAFQAMAPSVDITQVKAQKQGSKIVVTVTVADLPDASTGTGPLIQIGLDDDGGGFGASAGYYTADNAVFGSGVQSDCGATGAADSASNRVTVTFPKKCFPKATKITGVDVITMGYDGRSTDLPTDDASMTKTIRLKPKAK